MRRLLQGLVALVLGSSVAHSAEVKNFYDFDFPSIDGTLMPAEIYRGKVVLVVNTASECGFTPQYEGLQALWEKYRDQGLVVLGIPSNDFGGQEPGQAAEIKEFCAVNFSVDFPMTDKLVVKGDGAHPFYRWALQELGSLAKPRWNFHKYLIGRDGQMIDWFSSVTGPSSDKVQNAIEDALAAPIES